MADWRLANSLIVLRNEVNQMFPGRSKASDGAIGDARHQGEWFSDHNPNTRGVVCALDLTQDAAHGADMGPLTEYLRTHRPPALKYMIYNRRICSAKTGWAWAPYSGSSAHLEHAHFSVGPTPAQYDDTGTWNVAVAVTHAAPAAAVGTTTQDEDTVTPETMDQIAEHVMGAFLGKGAGRKTVAQVLQGCADADQVDKLAAAVAALDAKVTKLMTATKVT